MEKQVFMAGRGCLNPEHEERLKKFDIALNELVKGLLDEGFDDHQVVSLAVSTVIMTACEHRIMGVVNEHKFKMGE